MRAMDGRHPAGDPIWVAACDRSGHGGFLSRVCGRLAADDDRGPGSGGADTDERRYAAWTDVDPGSPSSGNLRSAFAVSPAMTTPQRPPRRFVLALAATILVLAACSGAAAPSTSPPASLAPSQSPSAPADGGSSGGGSDGNVGSGGSVIVDPTPVDPSAGEPTIVIPKAGQKNTHPVGATSLQASVDGRHVLVKVSWWSGVEPCNVLDSVKVERSGTDIAITIVEGSSDLDAMCMELAQLKATIVDLGELEPGTYTIGSPNSDAAPIQVTVS